MTIGQNALQPVTLYLCAPRGFCAGVDRAIQIVEMALIKFGPPVYVRHEIVHNQYVVEQLQQKGAVFVEELDEIPNTDAPVIFSAHGVPKSVPLTATARNLYYLDATCPLVSKVHMEAQRHYRVGRQLLLIGHAGHPEVIGTMGQLPEGAVLLIETAEDAARIQPADPENLAYITQTTLSVDDTAEIVSILAGRFPAMQHPKHDDICYATTNRQQVVKRVAINCDVMLVVGAPNSSNSQRLKEVAEKAGCPEAILIQRASEIDWNLIRPGARVGLTAGASAPEILVDEVVDAFRRRFNLSIEVVRTTEEDIAFNLPRSLRNVVTA